MFRSLLSALAATAILASASAAAQADGVVKVTPLGGQDGEFCRLDRALIFEDPTGTRLLYDAGRTVAGPDDPRLGNIDVVLVSHMHGDHAGNRHTKAPNAGSCGMPDFSVDATPNSSSANIAAKKGAKIVTGSEMAKFFAAKLKDAAAIRRTRCSCVSAPAARSAASRSPRCRPRTRTASTRASCPAHRRLPTR